METGNKTQVFVTKTILKLVTTTYNGDNSEFFLNEN